MSTPRNENYGTLTVIRGGQYATGRKKRRSAAVFIDWKLDDELHSVFVEWKGTDGDVPSRPVYDIREKKQRPWRYLAKRFREARRAGVPKAAVLAVLAVLTRFVEELYADVPSHGRAA